MKRILFFLLIFIFFLNLIYGKGFNFEDILKKYQINKGPKGRAKILIKQGKYKLAHKLLFQYLNKNPDDYEAYHLIGYTLEALKFYNKAKIAYEKAIELNPEFGDSYNNLAFLLLKQGNDIKKALRYAKIAINISPKNVNYLDTYAFALYKSGDLKKALNIYQELITKTPHSGIIFYHLGLVLEVLNIKEEAIKAYKNAITIDPNIKDVKKRIKTLEREIINNKKTVKTNKKHININNSLPFNNEIYDELAILKPFSLTWRKDSFKNEYKKGLDFFRNENYDDARQIWKRAIFWFDETGEVSEWIIKAIKYLGLIAESQKEFRLAREYYRLSNLLNAYLIVHNIKKLKENKEYDKALDKIDELYRVLPKTLKDIYNYMEKRLSLYSYAKKHGEDIYIPSKGEYKSLLYLNFISPRKKDLGNDWDYFIRQCRNGNYKTAIKWAKENFDLYRDYPSFILNYSQLLALNTQMERAWNILEQYPTNFFSPIRNEFIIWRIQLLIIAS